MVIRKSSRKTALRNKSCLVFSDSCRMPGDLEPPRQFPTLPTLRAAPCTTFGSELVVLDTSTFPGAHSSKLGRVLSIDPVYGMTRDVSTDGFIDRRKEGLFAEAREELEALQLILDWVLHFCEAQFNVRAT